MRIIPRRWGVQFVRVLLMRGIREALESTRYYSLKNSQNLESIQYPCCATSSVHVLF